MSGGYRGMIDGPNRGPGEYPDLPAQRKAHQDARDVLARQVAGDIDRLIMDCGFCEPPPARAIVRLLMPGGHIRPCCYACLQEHGPIAREVWMIPRAGGTEA